MNFSMKKHLKDKRVLYFVLFLALTNLFHFLFSRDFNGLTLFLVLGLLMSYFTKNMIVVLVVTMLVTHLFRRNLREGLQGKEEKNKGKKERKDKKDKEGMEVEDEEHESKTLKGEDKEKDASVETTKHSGTEKDGEEPEDDEEAFSSGRIDQASTIENAYDNLNNMVGEGGIKNLTKDTAMLIDKQKDLVSTMKSITPVLKDAMSLMNSGAFKSMGVDMNKITQQLAQKKQ